ncbi:GNAT family N-acetyltransferase [Streptomyces sp. NPDC058471]|uniref:GNAT family N-acetyltransferase n=1 Tax=Streptomyces sp. NPDC058471 TaxID=3346516 RepID=UPI00365CAB76
MSTLLSAPTPVTGITVNTETAGSSRALTEEIAALTRSAYTRSDPLPGLPQPDGALETAGQVAHDLAAHQQLWVARDHDGHAVAALRITARPASWEVRRVAVLPAWRGRGVTRHLLDTVQQVAAEQHIDTLHLDAVVERCLPDLYAHLGFTYRRVFRAGDKPLTEWHMERRPGPDRAPAAAAIAGLYLCWFTAQGQLLAFLQHAPDGAAAVAAARPHLPATARLAGLDVLPGTGLHHADDLLRHLPAQAAPGRPCALGQARTEVAFHLLPRSFEPRLLSLTRHAPGRERPLPQPTPTENE